MNISFLPIFQRLREVVVTDDPLETLKLIVSGADVSKLHVHICSESFGIVRDVWTLWCLSRDFLPNFGPL